MLFGLMPLYPGVSWQSHLGGALGGILAARAAARSARLL
jgi:membrane associated rhomboid family serine protease